MRKFKLIKEYIGSPKLGTIAKYTGDLFDKDNDLLPSVVKDKHFFEFWEEITKKEVIEYPVGTKVLNKGTNTIYTKKEDGWYNPGTKTAYTDENIRDSKNINVVEDEIIEKEYEILSIYTPKTKEILTDSNVETWENNIKSRGQWLINSIRRLSDGEVFTVSDILNGFDIEKTELTLFKIDNDKLKVGLRNLGIYQLNVISKYIVKQPLFTTEDGIDIFEGDEIYTVSVRDLTFKGKYIVKTKNFYLSTDYKDFSIKEAAEEYILMNKHCLSIKDIAPIFGQMYLDSSGTTLDRMTKKLQKLVKSKL